MGCSFRYLATLALILFGSLALPKSAYALRIVNPENGTEIQTEKVTHLSGYVDTESLFVFMRDLIITASLPGPRVILIHSHGGELSAGQLMIHLMEQEKASGVRQICIIDGYADSMAFNIASHCDIRVATPGSKMVAHVVADGGIDCTTMRCTPTRLREIADDLMKVDEPYRRVNAKALHLPLTQYDTYAAKDYQWTVEELIAHHYLLGTVTLSK